MKSGVCWKPGTCRQSAKSDVGHFTNYRSVKIHRTYTVDDVASSFGVHPNTVRKWLNLGLRTIDEKRPALIHGKDLASFLKARRRARRCPCGPGEIYCTACRAAAQPAKGVVTYLPASSVCGDLVGSCDVCGRGVRRRVSLSRLRESAGALNVLMPGAEGTACEWVNARPVATIAQGIDT
jgi:hypothetical protein